MNWRQICKWKLVQQLKWDMWCNHLMITLRVGGKNCGIMPSLGNSIKQMTFIRVRNGRSMLDRFKHWNKSCHSNYCFILKSLRMFFYMFHFFGIMFSLFLCFFCLRKVPTPCYIVYKIFNVICWLFNCPFWILELCFVVCWMHQGDAQVYLKKVDPKSSTTIYIKEVVAKWDSNHFS